MTKRTTLAVPYVTPQLFANVVITAMHKLQKASKSFLTTQGPEIRADKNRLLIFTIITPYYRILIFLNIQSLSGSIKLTFFTPNGKPGNTKANTSVSSWKLNSVLKGETDILTALTN